MRTIYAHKKLSVSCPICKTKKIIEVPVSVIDKSKQLTTISIQKGKVCNHHFQIFVDKNFVIRGFQKVDYEVSDQHFNSVLPKLQHEYTINNENITEEQEKEPKNCKKMSLNEIYEEFWEYINEDNETFKTFIANDMRRKKKWNERETPKSYYMNSTPHLCKNLE